MPGADSLVTTLALVGAVILVASLLSGLVERSRVPQVAVFLALGVALGPAGLGLLNLTLDAPVLQVVATLSLALVLFTDAVRVDIDEVRRHSRLALVALGPGTLLSAAIVALVAWSLLGLAPAAAAILGAALASTDPVLLRGLLQRRDLPATTRQILRLESGLNDAVLLPIVLVSMIFLGSQTAPTVGDWSRLGIEFVLLGPGAGVAVGLIGVAALDLVRRRVSVRRDYESLYSLGVAFVAYATAEAVHGSGFLAAFAAGLTIASLDVELCDCFLEYGQTTAELVLLFTFVLFGSAPIWLGITVLDAKTLLFAVIALLVRPLVLLLALARTSLDRRELILTAWFGPRGLSTLLLVYLPVAAGLTGSEYLFALCSLVVLLSIVIHGGSIMLLGRRPPSRVERATEVQPAEPSEAAPGRGAPETTKAGTGGEPSPGGATEEPAGEEVQRERMLRISIAALRQLWQRGESAIILDARTERDYNRSDSQAGGSIRFQPDHVAERAAELGLPRSAWIVAYCT